jgi:hypothetical protein
MTETEIRPARHALGAGDGANAADNSKSRLAMRLWTLLHAQALLAGYDRRRGRRLERRR